MKTIYKIIIGILIIAAAILIFVNKDKAGSVYEKIRETISSAGNNQTNGNPGLNESQTTGNATGGQSQGAGSGGGGAGGGAGTAGSGTSGSETVIPPSKVLTLEITDICDGKLENAFTVSEGMMQCLNQKSPYYIVLEKNSTGFATSFYNVTGFNETFDLNSTSPIFFVFAEDVASVKESIQSFYIEGSPDFYLGDYDLHTIWERDQNQDLYIAKIIVALPLYVKNTTIPNGEWSELKFYLNTSDKNYYLGNLWMLS
jgi:hypothetical protein